MSQDISQEKAVHTLREEGQFDYAIEVDDREFKVHKNLLVSVSDYFKAMLTGGMKENQTDRVTLHGLSSQCISILIDFIYTGKLSAKEVDDEELLSCAVYLQMPTAIQECATLLVDKLKNQNCFDIFTVFQNYNLESGVKQTTRYINSNIEEIMQTCLPLELSDDAFLCFVKFWKKAEWDLVCLVKEWIHMNDKDRHQYINKLMSCVRFALLTPEQLKAIKEMDIYTDSDGAWRKLVDKAEDYHRLPTHQKVLDESEQCTVRQDPVPVCYTATDTSSSEFYFLYDGKSWKQQEAVGAPDLYETHVFTHVTVNNFLIVCEEHHYQFRTQGWHIFDARTLKWSTMASMQVPRRAFALVHHGKHLYALGGHIPPKEGSRKAKVTKVIEQYDFETDTWNIIPSKLPESVRKPTAFVVDGLIYVCGGKTAKGHYSDRLDCLDLSTNTWSSKASLPGHPGVSKPRNKMELDGETVLFSLKDRYNMDIYRPSVDSWSQWSNCLKDANSVINPEEIVDVIVDRNNNIFLYGFIHVDQDIWAVEEDYHGFAKWTVVKPMEEISEVILDEYPAEQCSFTEMEWVSIPTFLSIPPQFH